MKSDKSLDADSIRVLGQAKKTISNYYKPGVHHVACALLGKSGRIYEGIHLDCAGYDTCAEPTAIAQAMLAKEAGLLLISSVMVNQRTGETEVVNPCGNCLQHLYAFAPDIEIITDTAQGLQRLPLSSLMPYPYSPAN